MHAPLVLASASPRRRELLQQLGVPFEVVTAETPELDADSAPLLSPFDVAVENARRKAAAIHRANPHRFILGADTVVALQDRLFGKPHSLSQAKEFLKALSGQTHDVITGCALFTPDGGVQLFHASTEVTFKILAPALIEKYLAHVHVLDKAGAYALQEHGDWIIEKVVGSLSNVIGLPLEKLEKILRERSLFSPR